jgi:hypothetical protein
MTKLASIKAISILFCIVTAVAASSQTSSSPGRPARTAPRIVKVVHLKNQTGSIGPVTLYTPKETGLFRVSLFMVITVGNGSFGFIDPSIGFTDSVGPNTGVGIQTSLVSKDKGNGFTVTNMFESVGGTPITLTTSAEAGSNITGATYNADVVIEALPDPSGEDGQ